MVSVFFALLADPAFRPKVELSARNIGEVQNNLKAAATRYYVARRTTCRRKMALNLRNRLHWRDISYTTSSVTCFLRPSLPRQATTTQNERQDDTAYTCTAVQTIVNKFLVTSV